MEISKEFNPSVEKEGENELNARKKTIKDNIKKILQKGIENGDKLKSIAENLGTLSLMEESEKPKEDIPLNISLLDKKRILEIARTTDIEILYPPESNKGEILTDRDIDMIVDEMFIRDLFNEIGQDINYRLNRNSSGHFEQDYDQEPHFAPDDETKKTVKELAEILDRSI